MHEKSRSFAKQMSKLLEIDLQILEGSAVAKKGACVGVSCDLGHIFFYIKNDQKVRDILSPVNLFLGHGPGLLRHYILNNSIASHGAN